MFLLRKNKRYVSLFLLLVFTATLNPYSAFATNGGPKQPEVKSFTPVGVTEMVDPFTGNFSYNIPLMDVGGYPINIAYSSDPSMGDVASWVGLGWNIGVGNIDRSVRGVPDDFSGDMVETTTNRKINQTVGFDAGVNAQIFGLKTTKLGIDVGLTLGLFYNSYTGFGSLVSPSLGFGLKMSESSKGSNTLGLGLSATAHSNDGISLNPNLSFDRDKKTADMRQLRGSVGLGASWNTIQGWRGFSITGGYSRGPLVGAAKRASMNTGYSLPTHLPYASAPTYAMNLSFDATVGGEVFGGHVNLNLRLYYSAQSLKDDILLPSYRQGLNIPGWLLPPKDIGQPDLDIALTRSWSNVSLPSYGYLYSHNSTSQKVIHDFNRENDGPFTINKPNLPVTSYTHDIFTVNGQGIGGVYRPFRNDIGVLHSPSEESGSTGLDFPPLEIGAGNTVHIGANLAVAVTKSKAGKWTDDNDFVANSLVGFRDFTTATTSDFQPYYFKSSGELTADYSESMLNAFGNFEPVNFKVHDEFVRAGITNEIEISGHSLPVQEGLFKTYRQPRNENIQFLNAEEASKFAVEKNIWSYQEGIFAMDETGRYVPSEAFERLDPNGGKPAHHISEITATTSEGVRYVFGIPVYNTVQKDVSFALECGGNGLTEYYQPNTDTYCQSNLARYDAGADNTKDNKKGIDHHFEERNTPPYAHSFLLNAVLSDEYVDIGDDGPTDDDIGSYTKFNYTKIEHINKWRTPLESGVAQYSKGMRVHPHDGRASYAYGERELWYMHSIETKTHVAEFILGDREDAIGALDENGGLDATDRMKKLVRIDLYAKPDKIKEVRSNGTYKAVPLKSVHFEYDYSLCPGIPDNIASQNHSLINNENQGGKLTLKKIYFTYQNSNKARLSPYEFVYGFNPSYKANGFDRWGTYKEFNCDDVLTNNDFPYTVQNPSLVNNNDVAFRSYPGMSSADRNAFAWNLSEIRLPSGSTIRVDYESDTYAYVQDKAAAQMFMIEGFGNSSNSNNITDTGEDRVDNVIFFRLSEEIPSGISSDEARQIIANQYLRQMVTDDEYLYFKCFISFPTEANLHNREFSGDIHEYVPGYAKIDVNHDDPYGAVRRSGTGNYDYGYVRIQESYVGKNAGEDDMHINTIQKWAIGLARMQMPWLFTGETADGAGCSTDNRNQAFTNNMNDFAKELVKQLSFVGSYLVQHTFRSLARRDFGEIVDLDKSFIRLYNAGGNKLGGGSRVKRITINDDWSTITGDPNNRNVWRGQEYSYALPDGTSSGVASWEPFVGGEENPFKQPVFVSENRLGIPDEEYFLERPIGESFYPSPVVGYSQVTVRDISGVESSNTIAYTYNKTGKSVTEYYTAKDFPVIARQTELDMNKRSRAKDIAMNIFKVAVKDYVTASQGYAIELNDMHGKMKSLKVYQETTENNSDVPISSVEYRYRTDPNTGHLDNEVMVMHKSAVPGKNDLIEMRTVGVDYDFITDMNEYESQSTVVTGEGNIEAFQLGPLPIFIPIILPSVQIEEVKLRTGVITKVIKRHGLLDSVITQDLGKHDIAKNEMYDAETGEAILRSTLNQYGDPVYAFTYPAYYGYDGMGPAYRNADVVFEAHDLDVIPGASQVLSSGDEVLVVNKDSIDQENSVIPYTRAWVETVTDDNVSLIDREGYPLGQIIGEDGTYVIKVIRSGRRNLQSMSMGSVVSLQNPLVQNADGTYTLSFQQVIDASAVEYNNTWKAFCNCDKTPPPIVPVK